jgi:hypothetical protein
MNKPGRGRSRTARLGKRNALSAMLAAAPSPVLLLTAAAPAATQPVSFDAARSFAVSANPDAVAVGDTVTVAVPHDRKRAAVDSSPPSYDSFGP